jgi:hypothetical protein
MKLGKRLSAFFKYSRCVAFLTCVVFLASVLDNIPDCPELLNQKSLASTSVHLNCHLDDAVIPTSFEASWLAASQLLVHSHPVMGAKEWVLPASDAALSLPLAADSSPPLV